MSKIYRILGKKGRTTVPFELRQSLGFTCGDLISFEVMDGSVTVKKEKICDGCQRDAGKESGSLAEYLDGLTANEQMAALVHLSANWARFLENTNEGGEMIESKNIPNQS
jgi:bifunctional DNA-binding transcriptional regulator/antitoxin component of YhaV-PrlF toxin-antitoxin module